MNQKWKLKLPNESNSFSTSLHSDDTSLKKNVQALSPNVVQQHLSAQGIERSLPKLEVFTKSSAVKHQVIDLEFLISQEEQLQPTIGASYSDKCAANKEFLVVTDALSSLKSDHSDKDDTRSAYLRHFEGVLTGVLLARPDYSALFTIEERAIAAAFCKLSPTSRGLYARLQLRKGPWFRVDSMLNYDEVSRDPPAWFLQKQNEQNVKECDLFEAENSIETFTEEQEIAAGNASFDIIKRYMEVLEALKELASAGFVEPLPTEIKCTGPELLKTFEALETCFRINDLRSLLLKIGGKAKGKNSKTASRKDLLDEIRRTVTGQKTLFGAPLPISRALDEVLDSSFNELRSKAEAAHKSNAVIQIEEKRSISIGPNKDILKFKGFRWLIFRTIAPSQFFDRVFRLHYMTCSVGGSSSIFSASSWYPGLLSAFGKVKYPEYKVNIKRCAFSGRDAFLRWESAVELRVAISSALLILNSRRSKTREAGTFSSEETLFGPNSISCIEDLFNVPSNEKVAEYVSISDDNDGYIIFLAKVASHCLCAYSSIHLRLYTSQKNKLDEGAFEICPVQLLIEKFTNLQEEDVCENMPDFLLQLDPGWVLGGAVWEGIIILEQNREYGAAIELLIQLLCSRVALQRRGQYWDRLTIDVMHFGLKEHARQLCNLALKDKEVRAGLKLSISKRLARLDGAHLAKNIQNSIAKKSKTSNSSETTIKKRKRVENCSNMHCKQTCNSKEEESNSVEICRSFLVDLNLNFLENDRHVASILAACSEMERNDSSNFSNFDLLGRRLNSTVGIKSRFVGYGDGEVCNVEGLVLQHFAQPENGSWTGWHCEGSPIRALFTLLMWDIVFADIPDVFQGPFQDAPLDINFPPLFYMNRRDLIEKRFDWFNSSTAVDIALEVFTQWNSHIGKKARWLHWTNLSLPVLILLAMGMEGSKLVTVFMALCLDSRHLGNGLPDLLLTRIITHSERDIYGELCEWLQDYTISGKNNKAVITASTNSSMFKTELMNYFNHASIELKLVEVKGPNDRLSDTQSTWLNILRAANFDVSLCNVIEREVQNHLA